MIRPRYVVIGLLLVALASAIVLCLVMVRWGVIPSPLLPRGWDTRCSRNLHYLWSSLDGIMRGGGKEKVDFLQNIQEGKSPIKVLAKTAGLPASSILCALQGRGDSVALLSEATSPDLVPDVDVGYETWPWTDAIWKWIENKGETPVIWCKRPCHQGKRMVATSIGRFLLMDEREFRESTNNVREWIAGPPENLFRTSTSSRGWCLGVRMMPARRQITRTCDGQVVSATRRQYCK